MTARTQGAVRQNASYNAGARWPLLLGTALVVACRSGVEPQREPTISSQYIWFDTPESDALLGHVLVIGDSGTASALSYTNDCVLEGSCRATPTLEFRSSNPSVVVPAYWRGRGPVRFYAIAPGQARVTFGDSTVLVTVVKEPLPIDYIFIHSGFPLDSVISEVGDSTGNLVQVVLPVHGYAAVWPSAQRSGRFVSISSWTFESSDSSVAWPSRYCRPESVDPRCEVASQYWITGLAAGTATVTFSVRNGRRSISVIVR